MPAERLPASDRQDLTPHQEDALFRHAMEDVHRMTPVKTAHVLSQQPIAKPPPNEEEIALGQLQRLVECGQGYRVADTPEYIEGRGLDVPRDLTRRLHQGTFSIQDHLDLHGLGVWEAQEAVEDQKNCMDQRIYMI